MQDNYQEKAKSVAKLSISPEVAQELVKAGTPTRHKSVQTFRKLADSAQMGEEIRLARLQSAWQQNAAGVWYATACFIVNDVADTSSIVAVYAPVSNSNPGGTVAETRFYVVWRGRWELLGAPASNSQPPQTTLETVLTNIAGKGVGWIGVLSQSSGAVATKVCHAVTVNQGGLMFDFVPTEIATVSNKTIRVFA